MRIVVIGAGVIGTAVAYELACAGAEVVLLERRTIGSGASFAPPGLIGPLTEALSERPTAALAAKALSATAGLVERAEADTGLSAGFARTGSIRVAGDATEAESFRGWASAPPDEVPLRWLTPAEVRSEEPNLDAGEFGALLCPTESQVTPSDYVRVLARAAVNRGVGLTEGIAVEAILGGDRVMGVRTAGGDVPADAVVIAAGAWSGLIPGALGLPVRPLRGARLALDPGRALTRRIIYVESCDLAPKPNGEVWVGATEEDRGFHDSVTAQDLRNLSSAAVATVPLLREARFVEARAGLRPTTPDLAPILGEVAPGLFAATGHWRKGVMLAAITARLMRQAMLGEATDIDLAPFSARRFAS